MNCNNCGHPIPEGDNFCTRCGTPVPVEKRCPNCNALLADGDIFCGKCGTRVGGNAQPVTDTAYESNDQQPYQPEPAAPYNYAPQQPYQPEPAAPYNYAPQQPYQPEPASPYHYGTQQSYQPGQNPAGGNAYQSNGYTPGYSPTQPQQYKMISKYVGEPTVGIAKASGTLYVYLDRLEYVKTMGSSLGASFGVVGMVIAANKMKKTEGNVDVFYFRDIQNAYVGKYAGLMPAVVLVLNDGQVFSFNGTFNNQKANDIVNTILRNK